MSRDTPSSHFPPFTASRTTARTESRIALRVVGDFHRSPIERSITESANRVTVAQFDPHTIHGSLIRSSADMTTHANHSSRSCAGFVVERATESATDG